MIAVSAAAWTVGGLLLIGTIVAVLMVSEAVTNAEFRDCMLTVLAGMFVIAGLAGLAWLIGAALTWAGVVA